MSEPLKRQCIRCDGRGNLGGHLPCDHCHGSGQEIITRDEAWSRDRAFLGSAHPDSDKNGHEKWVRYAAEVPPELAALIDKAHRKSLGMNALAFSRAGVVRAGLRLYLNA